MSDDNRHDWSADEWAEFLRRNPDKTLMLIDDQNRIHEFEMDEGQLSFVASGAYGYDESGTRAALEEFAQADGGAFKVVDSDEVLDEREKLGEGEYETIADWTDNAEEVDDAE